MSRLKELIHEIHRRSLWQVLGIYVVGAWLAYQVILDLTEGGILPEWFPGVAVGLFIVGLPIVLATAFVQEGAPGKVFGPDQERPDGDAADRASSADAHRSEPAPETASAPQPAGSSSQASRLLTWRNAVGLGVVAFVFAGLVGVAAMWIGGDSPGSTAADQSVAVLPFENMSPDPDAAFFADGIHEEIITQLARIREIRVIARQSVLEYRETARDLDEIAAELGVRHLLVGSVRRAGERVRISTQLLDPATAEPIWGDSYEGAGTDVFGMQREVAENVARELEATLSPEERSRLESRPTDNAEAYDFYLRARTLLQRSYDEADMTVAAELLGRAIELDPEFAHAYAQVGFAHAQIYWYHYDHTDERRRASREATGRALALDPDLPEAHWARAWYLYWCELAYDEALQEAELALAGAPGWGDVHGLTGAILRRDGRVAESLPHFHRAQELDPRDWLASFTLSATYKLLRRPEPTLAWADSTIRLAPHRARSWDVKTAGTLELLGDTARTRRIVDGVPEATRGGDRYRIRLRYTLASYRGDHDAALAALEDAPEAQIFAIADQFTYRPRTLLAAQAYERLGDRDRARAAYQEARRRLEQIRDSIPDDVRMMAALAVALQGLGRDDEALAMARQAYDALPMGREAWRGAYLLENLAYIQARTGRLDQAVANLETLLDRPTQLTIPVLRMDPRWDPLRDHPGFQALLTESP